MPVIDMMATGQKIKDMITKAGMTMREAADIMGVTPMACSKWVNGKTMPTIDNMVIIAHICGVTVNDIIVIAG